MTRLAVLCILASIVLLFGRGYVERVSLRAASEPMKAGAVGVLIQLLFFPVLIAIDCGDGGHHHRHSASPARAVRPAGRRAAVSGRVHRRGVRRGTARRQPVRERLRTESVSRRRDRDRPGAVAGAAQPAYWFAGDCCGRSRGPCCCSVSR